MECQHPECSADGDYPMVISREGSHQRFFFCAPHYKQAKQRRAAGQNRSVEDRIEELFGEKFRDATFGTFRTDPDYFQRIAERIEAALGEGEGPTVREEDIRRIQSAKEEVKALTSEMVESGEGTVFLFGPNGLGKTHLLAASTRRLIQSGRTVSSWHMTQLLNTIRATYSAEPATEVGTVQSIIESMMEADVLVLQDISEMCFSSDIRDYIFEIIDSVYRDRGILMMSANLTPEELMDEDRLGTPAVTRLLEPPSCIKHMTGPSHRQARKAYEKLN